MTKRWAVLDTDPAYEERLRIRQGIQKARDALARVSSFDDMARHGAARAERDVAEALSLQRPDRIGWLATVRTLGDPGLRVVSSLDPWAGPSWVARALVGEE